MSKSAEDNKPRWDQVMENFGFLFSRVSDIGFIQQELKAHMDINSSVVDKYCAEQHMIAQQVKANGRQWPNSHYVSLPKTWNPSSNP